LWVPSIAGAAQALPQLGDAEPCDLLNWSK